MTSTAPDPAPADPVPPRPEAQARVHRHRVHRADVLLAAGTVLFLLLLLPPWVRADGYDLGSGYRSGPTSADGLDSGLLVTAAVLLVLAACWSLLPAVAEVPTPVPRALVTTVLVALAALLTLLEWLTLLDSGVAVPGLLAVLTVAGLLAVAVGQLVPQARAWVAEERAGAPGPDVT
jgi:hypothetical protein